MRQPLKQSRKTITVKFLRRDQNLSSQCIYSFATYLAHFAYFNVSVAWFLDPIKCDIVDVTLTPPSSTAALAAEAAADVLSGWSGKTSKTAWKIKQIVRAGNDWANRLSYK